MNIQPCAFAGENKTPWVTKQGITWREPTEDELWCARWALKQVEKKFRWLGPIDVELRLAAGEGGNRNGAVCKVKQGVYVLWLDEGVLRDRTLLLAVMAHEAGHVYDAVLRKQPVKVGEALGKRIGLDVLVEIALADVSVPVISKEILKAGAEGNTREFNKACYDAGSEAIACLFGDTIFLRGTDKKMKLLKRLFSDDYLKCPVTAQHRRRTE